ncbi:unnamed protein product [Pylaiella littoralis]
MTTAAVGSLYEVTVTDRCTERRLPQSAVLGCKVFDHMGTDALMLECVAPARGSRSVFTPPSAARIHRVDPGDGGCCCAYQAVRGALKHCCVGAAGTKTKEDIKQIVVASGTQHVLHGLPAAASSATAGAATPPIEGSVPLSACQLERLRGLRMLADSSRTMPAGGDPMIVVSSSEEAAAAEASEESRTHEWLDKSVRSRVETDQFDVTWLALLADGLGVNVAVWEPVTGDNNIHNKKTVQLYNSAVAAAATAAGGEEVRGLFLCDKNHRMDEGGGLWVHLLHNRLDNSSGVFAQQQQQMQKQLADPQEASSPAPRSGRLSMRMERKEPASGSKENPQPVHQATQTIKDGSRAKQKPLVPDASPATATKPPAPKVNERGKKRKIGEGSSEKAGSSSSQGKGKGKARSTGADREGGRKISSGGCGSIGSIGSSEDHASYDSDGSIGAGDTDYYHFKIPGAFASLTKNRKKLVSDLSKIAEPKYKRAFMLCSERKTLGQKLLQEKRNAAGRENDGEQQKQQQQQRPGKRLEEKADGKQEVEGEWSVEWTDKGILNFAETDAHERRHRRPAVRGVSLSKSAREKLPSLDDFIGALDPKTGKFPLETVVLTCFDMNFPREAVELLADKTNGYVDLCTAEPLEGKSDTRRPHQIENARSLGRTTTTAPDPALPGQVPVFEEKHIYGMFGLLITMGLTVKSHMSAHWSTSPAHDYPLVRKCMQLDLFELLYCRFLHCSDGNAPPRLLPNGEDNPAFDSKWHIRLLEEILNKVWTDNVDINQWLRYDEENLVETTSAFADDLTSSYGPPITNGITIWALRDTKGYCLASNVDGGMKGDPKLRRWFNCPLGRTTRQVLWALLGACPELRDKLEGSGVYIAMDDRLTSPTLFECLASHDIFAVGRCRAHMTAGAAQYWQSLDRSTLEKGGEVNFCRSGEMAFVQSKKDSKGAAVLCSTVHIAQEAAAGGMRHFRSEPLEVRGAFGRWRQDDTQQPRVRTGNLLQMAGIGKADERNGSHDDGSRTNNPQERVQNAGGEEAPELRRAIRALDKLAKLHRDDWDEDIATKLMARCNVGSIDAGKKKTAFGLNGRRWGSVQLKGARECMNPVCNQRSRYGCSCDDCKRGGQAGILMCGRCFRHDDSHHQAAIAQSNGVRGGRRRKPMAWLS